MPFSLPRRRRAHPALLQPHTSLAGPEADFALPFPEKMLRQEGRVLQHQRVPPPGTPASQHIPWGTAMLGTGWGTQWWDFHVLPGKPFQSLAVFFSLSLTQWRLLSALAGSTAEAGKGET